jgi:DNA-binding MarR family transcriptional regulator
LLFAHIDLGEERETMAGDKTNIREFRKNLRALEREIESYLSSDTLCCGVTLAQCHLLLEVEDREETSVTELSDLLELDKSTLSRTVEGLRRSGMLARDPSRENRRSQVISLTGEGRRKAESINGLCDRSYERVLDFLPPEKREGVIEGVALLADAMRRTRKEDLASGGCAGAMAQTENTG